MSKHFLRFFVASDSHKGENVFITVPTPHRRVQKICAKVNTDTNSSYKITNSSFISTQCQQLGGAVPHCIHKCDLKVYCLYPNDTVSGISVGVWTYFYSCRMWNVIAPETGRARLMWRMEIVC